MEGSIRTDEGKLYKFTKFGPRKYEERITDWIPIEVDTSSVEIQTDSLATHEISSSEFGDFIGRVVFFNEKGGLIYLIDLPRNDQLWSKKLEMQAKVLLLP